MAAMSAPASANVRVLGTGWTTPPPELFDFLPIRDPQPLTPPALQELWTARSASEVLAKTAEVLREVYQTWDFARLRRIPKAGDFVKVMTVPAPFNVPTHIFHRVLEPEFVLGVAATYLVLAVLTKAAFKRKAPPAPTTSYRSPAEQAKSSSIGAPLYRVASVVFRAAALVRIISFLTFLIVTLLALYRTATASIPRLDADDGLNPLKILASLFYSHKLNTAPLADAFCKAHGPPGIGNSTVWETSSQSWVTFSPHTQLDYGLPDSTDRGRLWNEGLAFWSWVFYMAQIVKFGDSLFEIVDHRTSTFLIITHNLLEFAISWANVRFMNPLALTGIVLRSSVMIVKYTGRIFPIFGLSTPRPLRYLYRILTGIFLLAIGFAAVGFMSLEYDIPTVILKTVKQKSLKEIVVTVVEQATSTISEETSTSRTSTSSVAASASVQIGQVAKKLLLYAVGEVGMAENVRGHDTTSTTSTTTSIYSPAIPPITREEIVTQEMIEDVQIEEVSYERIRCVSTPGQSLAASLNLVYLLLLALLLFREAFSFVYHQFNPLSQIPPSPMSTPTSPKTKTKNGADQRSPRKVPDPPRTDLKKKTDSKPADHPADEPRPDKPMDDNADELFDLLDSAPPPTQKITQKVLLDNNVDQNGLPEYLAEEFRKTELANMKGIYIFDLHRDPTGDFLQLTSRQRGIAIQNIKRAAKLANLQCQVLPDDYNGPFEGGLPAGAASDSSSVGAASRSWGGAVVLRREAERPEKVHEVRVSAVGDVGAGKSTLLGVLGSGTLDEGKGKVRQFLLKTKEEIESGQSMSASMTILGFNEAGRAVHTGQLTAAPSVVRDEDIRAVVARSNRIISLNDLPGDERYMNKLILSMSGTRPDYCLLVIDCKAGLTRTTREHLQLARILKLRVFVAVTKIDLCSADEVEETMAELRGELASFHGMATIPSQVVKSVQSTVEASTKFASQMVYPIFFVSTSTGENMNLLHLFLSLLPPESERPHMNIVANRSLSTRPESYFEISDRYHVPGVGTTASGTVMSGYFEPNDFVYIGPDILGHFFVTRIKDIFVLRNKASRCSNGQEATVLLQQCPMDKLRRGMVIQLRKRPAKKNAAPNENPLCLPELKGCREFVVDMTVLPNSSTIKSGIQFVAHIRSMEQPSTIHFLKLAGVEAKENGTGPGQDGQIIRGGVTKRRVLCRFQKGYHIVCDGDQVIFRDGDVKAHGTVVQVVTDSNPLTEEFEIGVSKNITRNERKATRRALGRTPSPQKKPFVA